MRAPKFRGFSKETNSWYYGFGWFKVDVDYTEEGISNKACLCSEGSPVECELPSMGEFTGMVDAKGKEIFEGDILQASNGEKGLYAVVWKDGGFKRQYRFIRKYEGEEWEDATWANVFPNGFKVVGNVYEQGEPLN